MKPSHIALILVLAVLGAGAGVFVGQRTMIPQGPALPEGTLVLQEGDRRPDAELQRVGDAGTGALSDYDGRPLLINFWATWCPPCVEELPLLDGLHARTAPAGGLQVIGIALDDPEEVERFLGELPVEFPMYLATPGRVDLSTTLGNSRSVLPYSVLIDADGRIAKRKFGAFSERSLAEWVAGFEGLASE